MKILSLCLALVVSPSFAAGEFVCSGQAELKLLSGYYALVPLIEAAPKLRSWPAILNSVESDKAGLAIRDGQVFFNRSWHEGDTGGNCVRKDAQGLWVKEAEAPHAIFGPYRQLAGISERENLAYLSLFLNGCFVGSNGAHWCFSRQQVTVNGQPFAGAFELDAMEFPEYGTSFRVPGQTPPLLVFVPDSDGWAVYQDDFVSTEGRIPVVPGRTKPVLFLKTERKQ